MLESGALLYSYTCHLTICSERKVLKKLHSLRPLDSEQYPRAPHCNVELHGPGLESTSSSRCYSGLCQSTGRLLDTEYHFGDSVHRFSHDVLPYQSLCQALYSKGVFAGRL